MDNIDDATIDYRGGARQAPEMEAKYFILGTRRMGVDKKMWKVVKTSTGIKRWQRVSSGAATTRKNKDEKRQYTRRAPRINASTLEIGTRRKGLDGYMYQVTSGVFGKKWVKIEKSAKSGRKYRTLRTLWERLSKGEMIILIMRDGTIKPVSRFSAMRVWKRADENDKIEAVITSSISERAFTRFYEKAKGHSVEDVLRNYKLYFNHSRVVSDKDWIM